jgi:Protein-disulfide isomerase
VVRRVQEHLGDRLRFVFRYFPLTEAHPHAEHAAETAEWAARWGRFWEMHDMLFERQSEDPEALDDGNLLSYASELGLDSSDLKEAILEETYRPRVREDFMSGVRSGVNGTPTFFINGARHDGLWDEESLLAALVAAASASGASVGAARTSH